MEHLSLCTTPVLLRKGDTVISQGTGIYFYWENKGGPVKTLVKNYHVMTGWAPLKEEEPKGDNILFYLHKSEEEVANVKEIIYPLFTNGGERTWFTHPDVPAADVAVLPLPSQVMTEGGYQLFPISKTHVEVPMKVRATSTVTLIGYPHGFYDAKNQLPIYKTGSVASEPEVDFDGEPKFMVDVSNFPGMSGSPVIAVATGMYESSENRAVSPGSPRRFLGVFASDIVLKKDKYLEELGVGEEERGGIGIRNDESLQLGAVWKASLLTDLIEAIDLRKYESEILPKLTSKWVAQNPPE